MKRLVLLILLICSINRIKAQQFVINVSTLENNKVKVEWINPYGDSVVQINIQRSWDSAKNFRTAFAPLSPELPQNGYVDDNAGYNGYYYRALYVFNDGKFFFTKAKKITTGQDFTDEVSDQQKADTNFLITVHDDDTLVAQLAYTRYKHFKDSIISYTRDTLYSLSDADVLIRYFNNSISWIPSKNVFTTTDGYVQILLGDAATINYRLKVLDQNHKLLFNIPHINQTQLLLDKTDFMHSGWFYFELYQNDKIKERNKFYIPKDF